MGVNQLHQMMEVSQSVVSQHLKLFKFQGLVSERKEGTHVYYSLKNPLLVKLISDAIELQTQDITEDRNEEVALLIEMRGLWQEPQKQDNSPSSKENRP